MSTFGQTSRPEPPKTVALGFGWTGRRFGGGREAETKAAGSGVRAPDLDKGNTPLARRPSAGREVSQSHDAGSRRDLALSHHRRYDSQCGYLRHPVCAGLCPAPVRAVSQRSALISHLRHCVTIWPQWTHWARWLRRRISVTQTPVAGSPARDCFLLLRERWFRRTHGRHWLRCPA